MIYRHTMIAAAALGALLFAAPQSFAQDKSIVVASTTSTLDSGLFEYLLPGEYSISIEKPGVGTARRAAVVEVGKDTQLDSVIGITLSEQVSVTPATPAVDVRSTEVSFNVKEDVLKALPLERTYRGLFQLIPGVADNNSFAPSGGAGRQDNKYLIDGVDITNPGFGYLSTEVNGLDIAEFNVKRGAITAEFGRATGFVTNAISRSGTNAFHGIANVELRPRSFSADERAAEHVARVLVDDLARYDSRWTRDLGK